MTSLHDGHRPQLSCLARMHVNLMAAATDNQPIPQASTEYAELKRQIQGLGLLKRQPGYYTAKFVITGGLLGLAILAMTMSGNDPWIRLAEAAFLAVVSAGLRRS